MSQIIATNPLTNSLLNLKSCYDTIVRSTANNGRNKHMSGTYYETDGLFTVLIWGGIWIPYIWYLCRLEDKKRKEEQRRCRLRKREILRRRNNRYYQ